MKRSLARRSPKKPIAPANDIESLYFDLLHVFYGNEDRERALPVAERLRQAIEGRRDIAESIRGDEYRALIAEIEGDLPNAIGCREREIRKILLLHDQTSGTPSWEYVIRSYDRSDLSDRLDLLAALYADHGDGDRALQALRESKQYCKTHGIRFDAQDMLDEFERDFAEVGSASGGTAR